MNTDEVRCMRGSMAVDEKSILQDYYRPVIKDTANTEGVGDVSVEQHL